MLSYAPFCRSNIFSFHLPKATPPIVKLFASSFLFVSCIFLLLSSSGAVESFCKIREKSDFSPKKNSLWRVNIFSSWQELLHPYKQFDSNCNNIDILLIKHLSMRCGLNQMMVKSHLLIQRSLTEEWKQFGTIALALAPVCPHSFKGLLCDGAKMMTISNCCHQISTCNELLIGIQPRKK